MIGSVEIHNELDIVRLNKLLYVAISISILWVDITQSYI